MTAEEVAERLGGRRVGPARWVARCPAHDDKEPSLSVAEGDDGRVLIHCHAGCPTAEVLSRAGLTWADLWPPDHVDRRLARRLAREAAGTAADWPDARDRAMRRLRDWAEATGRTITDELRRRELRIKHADELLRRGAREAAWEVLAEAYAGMAELEWVDELLRSREPRCWAEARRWLAARQEAAA